MTKKERISAFIELGNRISLFLSGKSNRQAEFEAMIQQVYFSNKWFVEENTKVALHAITLMLDSENLEKWVQLYPLNDENSPKRVAVIMAGNIPLVGFHDLLCVLISGNILLVKPSSQDEILLNFIVNELISIHSGFEKRIYIYQILLKDFDAVIATGSNNSSRYFDHYFSKSPHIIRKHRNSVAVLSGKESLPQLENLAKDIFMYFGLGCRNVSKIFIPINFDLNNLIQSFENFKYLSQHSKYFNNYEFNKSVFLINKIPHFDNGFLLLTENDSLYSPVAVLHYEFYTDFADLNNKLDLISSQLQCIVGDENNTICNVVFGNTQNPALNDYADNVDTMEFLCHL